MQRQSVLPKGNRQSRCVKETPKCLIFGELACLGAFPGGVSAMLMTGRLEIESPIVVLLTVPRARAPVMKSNGKCQVRKFQ